MRESKSWEIPQLAAQQNAPKMRKQSVLPPDNAPQSQPLLARCRVAWEHTGGSPATLRERTLQGGRQETERQPPPAPTVATLDGRVPGGFPAGTERSPVGSSSSGRDRPAPALPSPAPAWAAAKPHRNAAGHMRCGGGGRAAPPAPQGDPAPSCPDAVTKVTGAIVSPRPRQRPRVLQRPSQGPHLAQGQEEMPPPTVLAPPAAAA
ncbi:skin secretory protein xP2-like [Heterocephalus glaber]|uniref:Skin secretory protein xP2-like n=1 Tax=Heterocephalus glaber TaxID=10181 RepID=A0AAX6SLN7_HETGA|nr:skin secretory protein xP2-like [Heterocephalus glaber]